MTPSCTRILVAFWLLGTALAFTTPRLPSHRLVKQAPTVLLPPIELHATNLNNNNGLFGTNPKPTFSLRRLVRKALRFTVQDKRKRLAALVFAASVWLRGLPLQEMPVAHASAMVEQVESNFQLSVEEIEPDWRVSGGASESVADTLDAAATEEVETVEAQGTMTRKLSVSKAMAGVVIVLPSAGLVYARGKTKDNEATVDPVLDVDTKGATGNADEDPTDAEKRDLVQKVLDKAKSARLKVDSDTYLKSLAKEKSLITSAIQQMKSALSSEEVSPEVAEAVPVVSRSTMREAGAASTVATNAELPLMTPKFIKARQQPKDARTEQRLQQKYKSITNVGDRAFQILVDLGMIETDGAEFNMPVGDSSDDEEEPFQ